MWGKDFLSIADLDPQELSELLELAADLKIERRQGAMVQRLEGKALAMVFQKPSLRTRVSFEMAMTDLGGRALYLSPAEVGMGARESVADVARVLSRFVDAIMARVFDHAEIVSLARWASVPVINGLSDYNHPCQALADLLTIGERIGHLEGVRLAYLGDGNNVLHSLIFAAALTGMELRVATPEGYEPDADVVARGREMARVTGASIVLEPDPRAAVLEADVLYTDTWTSMGQEEESERRARIFPPYQINAELLALAAPGAGVMHCLPAHRGQEITDEVADGGQSWLWDQAENRLHSQKAVLVRLLQG
ncbi:MAG: ornithine carbamoyltransferase [Anaerolineae bacterium]|jgi:ornithine carbamoyltransferase